MPLLLHEAITYIVLKTHRMCRAKILHSNEFGLVMKCPAQDGFQVIFGNVVLLQSEEKLYDFAAAIHEYSLSRKGCSCQGSESILFQTPAENMLLALRPRELALLDDLLQQATLMATVGSLLD
jgi:hypothetical protein